MQNIRTYQCDAVINGTHCNEELESEEYFIKLKMTDGRVLHFCCISHMNIWLAHEIEKAI